MDAVPFSRRIRLRHAEGGRREQSTGNYDRIHPENDITKSVFTEFPMDFCDLTCKYASFPPSEAVDGSCGCRTYIALYCMSKRSLAHKNLPCGEKRTIPEQMNSCTPITKRRRS
jgi:hypothetical protein